METFGLRQKEVSQNSPMEKTLKVFSPFQDAFLHGIFAKIKDDSQWKPLGSPFNVKVQ